MTSVLEKAIAVIAPFRCISCGNYNNIACHACMANVAHIEAPLCALCGVPTVQWRLCEACGQSSALTGVWLAATYEGLVRQLVKRYKFGHVRAVCTPLARLVADTLPYLDDTWVIVAVPTAANRIRQRGYDQTYLLAKAVAKLKRVPFAAVLGRYDNRRQVGAARAQRLAQAQGMFYVRQPQKVAGRNVIVIDDVCTTGATLSACAAVVQVAGAQQVWGAVAAWQPPDTRKDQ